MFWHLYRNHNYRTFNNGECRKSNKRVGVFKILVIMKVYLTMFMCAFMYFSINANAQNRDYNSEKAIAKKNIEQKLAALEDSLITIQDSLLEITKSKYDVKEKNYDLAKEKAQNSTATQLIGNWSDIYIEEGVSDFKFQKNGVVKVVYAVQVVYSHPDIQATISGTYSKKGNIITLKLNGQNAIIEPTSEYKDYFTNNKAELAKMQKTLRADYAKKGTLTEKYYIESLFDDEMIIREMYPDGSTKSGYITYRTPKGFEFEKKNEAAKEQLENEISQVKNRISSEYYAKSEILRSEYKAELNKIQNEEIAAKKKAEEEALAAQLAKEEEERIHLVDLGLSVKWADRNVGAKSTEEIGTLVNYDRKDIPSELRLPSVNEVKELIKKCTWTWVVSDKLIGYKITGPNGNSIFMVAAGYYGKVTDFKSVVVNGKTGDDFIGVGLEGYYMTNSEYSSFIDVLRFTEKKKTTKMYPREAKYLIRCVEK